jgi:hypothetical protein
MICDFKAEKTYLMIGVTDKKNRNLKTKHKLYLNYYNTLAILRNVVIDAKMFIFGN